VNGPPAPATGLRAEPGWGVRRRIAVALVAGGVGLLAVVALSGTVLTEVQDAQTRVVDNSFAAQGMSNRRFISWLDMETAVRGYALTKNRSSLQPMQDALATQAQNPTARIRALLRNDPESQADLDTFDAAADRWYHEWALPAIATIDSTGALPPAEAERGQVLFNQIRVSYEAYSTQVRINRTDAVRSLRWRTDLLFVAVVVSALGAVAVAVLLWWLLRRWVSGPVEALAREARVVSAGDLDHAVRVDGPPEFVALAADMDAMRRRLVDQIAEVEAGRREIAEGQARLEAQAAALEKSNRDLEQFAYVASHDLQEPLRKVASFCQMLQRRYAGKMDERADQYIAYAVDGALRMQQLINALLEFSRVGRVAVPETLVDLEQCIEHAVSNLEVTSRESGAEITWDPLPSVRGEPALLTQLLQNLLANAIKFRSEAAPRAHIGVRRDGQLWAFSCEDNGIGIESRYAERVFLIFQQLHTRETYGGTGIGLALCRRIVEYHGGMIWVEQRPGPGTMIRWTLPVARGVPEVDGAGNGEQRRARDEAHGERGVGDSAQVAAIEGSGQDDP
jgi:signal transduction histidine kinase